MSFARILRLGLRQFVAGMLSVLALGILNRVMKVEMGLDLGLVGLVIGAHYFAAPLAIPLGHRSDRKPLFQLHRTPYILAGAALTASATAAAPYAALHIGRQAGAPGAWLVGLAVFLLLGIGIYTSGTAYLSLVADLTPEHERPKAVSIVWSMMMVGILAGVLLGVGILDTYTASRLTGLFLVVAVAVFGLTLIAVWGQEQRTAVAPAAAAVPLPQAIRLMTRNRQARIFFAFLCMGILFLFLQQVVLEPFGGDVFGLDVRQTTLFNAFQMVGVLAGMAAGGAWLSRRLGTRGTAALGLILAALSFAMLALAALAGKAFWVRPAILVMGLGMGLFNVGGLALMMGMSVEGSIGLYMGAWTLAQAVANGLASVGGGALFDAAYAVLGTTPAAYAAVFGLEAVGLCGTAWMLSLVSAAKFREEAQGVAPSWSTAR
ncbi:MAG: BCD family MFS transporter [Chloroflexota bacterium]